MLDKQKLIDTVNQAIQGTPLFLVGVTVSADNIVEVTVDSPRGVDIDQCVALTRAIEQAFDRQEEDYELTVGSAGVTAPFTVPGQYMMNVGCDVDVLTADGRRLHATLQAYDPQGQTVTLATQQKIKPEGARRPVLTTVTETLPLAAIKKMVREIKF